MWIVVNISGKQEIIRINQVLDINFVNAKENDILILNRILLVKDKINKLCIGRPLLNKKVQSIIVQHFFGKKLLILRYKKKKTLQKNKGF